MTVNRINLNMLTKARKLFSCFNCIQSDQFNLDSPLSTLYSTPNDDEFDKEFRRLSAILLDLFTIKEESVEISYL